MIRRLVSSIAIALLASTQLEAAAQDKAPEHPLKPLLWKVEGGGLEKASWLFGTIHIGKGPVGNLHPTADKALASSDTIYTEVSMDPVNQLGMVRQMMRTDGEKLSDSIGKDIHNQLQKELKAINPQLTPAAFEPLKTWVIAITIPILEDQLGGEVALDQVIWNKAQKHGKKTAALEKISDQFDIFDRLTEQEQVTLLTETLRHQREYRAKGEKPMQALIDAYISGEPDKVEALVISQFEEMEKGEHKELGRKLRKQVLDDRNTSMTLAIIRQLKAEPANSHFFAVGAGHYIGKDNIGEQLRKQGYTVTLTQP